ncbi:UvrD-like helicase family protein [Arenibacter algicola]|uniref:DNA 3'-5' helicase n=1 Tax=Arenibacter algicola TaxID=616991 RepID=A0ABY3AD42_9FLAO
MLKQIILKGEQKKVLFLPPTNPIQIKGVAGSGKTTVALYRAKHLLETQANLFKETKIVIFTYNKTLAAYIEAVKPFINGGYQENSDEIKPRTNDGLNVKVTNFHKWAYHYLNLDYGKIINDQSKKKFIRDSASNIEENLNNQLAKNSVYTDLQKKNIKEKVNKILHKSDEFLKEEISWIKGKLFNEKVEYIEAKRTGRGTSDRVTKDDKIIIWVLYENYNKLLKKNDKIDFDDFAILTLEKISNDANFQPLFTHIIIDEAQDLNKAQILAIAKLVDPETNSLSIIADAAQRIFKSGFTWSEVGIEVRGGRTISFKKNYRNTLQIASAAKSLLEKESDNEDFTDIEFSVREGEKPKVAYYSNFNEQLKHLNDQLTILKNSNNLESTVVLHRSTVGVNQIQGFLINNGYSTEIVRSNTPINYMSDSIKICTMSSVKGLEFDNVFIVNLNDDVVPYPPGFNESNDEFHISTERRLLYTSMTRAKNKLFLFSSNKDNPSRYLKEIDLNLLDDISPKNYPKSNYDDEDDLPF